MKVIWSPTAEIDLHNIYVYVAKDSVRAAEDLTETIFFATLKLADFPLIGKEGREPGTRELMIPSTPYFVSYKVHNKTVEIAAIIHGARQWPG
jgi:toxin ParE1/3/4